MERAITVAMCGFWLAACSASNSDFWRAPNFNPFSPKPITANLTIASVPPGAEARTSHGLSCITPCVLAVPTEVQFGVTFTLSGHVPQSTTIRPVAAAGSTFPIDIGLGVSPALSPNPVVAELKPIAPLSTPVSKTKKRRLAATARSTRPLEPVENKAPNGRAPAAKAPSAAELLSGPKLQNSFGPPPGTFTPMPNTVQ